MYLCFLMLFFCNLFLPAVCGGVLKASQCAGLVVFFFIGLLFTCAVGCVLSDKISTKVGMIVVACFVAVASPLAVFSFVLEASFIFTLWCLFFSGCGSAGFLMLASGYIGRLPHNILVTCIPLCMGIAAFNAAIALHIRPVFVCLIYILCISTLGATLSFYVYTIALGDKSRFVCAKESKKRNRMSLKSAAASSSQACCLGYAICLMVILGANGYSQVILAASAAVIIATIIVFFDRHGGKEPVLTSEKNQLRFFLPCAAIGLLPIAFVDSVFVKIICCDVLLLVFSLQAATNIYAISENVRLFSLQPIRTYTGSRIANYSGYLLGAVVALVSFGRELSLSAVSEMLTLAMIVILAFLAALFFTDRFPVDEFSASFIDENSPSAENAEFCITGACEDNELPIRSSGWKRRCSILASRIGLSPRQEEVLILLSRGYSAKYIEEHLFISYHTVKSHIHNIYLKADVHSREELIELIEEVSFE